MLGESLDPMDIRRTWDLIATPEHVVEVRILRRNGPPGLGRFNSVDAFEHAVRHADDRSDVSGIYVTLNPVRPDAPWPHPLNRIVLGGPGAKDADIAFRRWLLVDLDPRRPTKTNATTTERQAAFDAAGRIGRALRRKGWPDPVQATSGNGAHLLYRLTDWPNDGDSTQHVQRMLRALALQFTTETVDVDISVFNASRISKVYGTIPKKGDPSPGRPWWPSRIFIIPDPLVPLNPLRADSIEDWLPKEEHKRPVQPSYPRHRRLSIDWPCTLADVQNRLGSWGIEQRSDPIPYGDGFKILVSCPWEADHTAGASQSEAAVFWWSQGGLMYHCFHAHCADKQWRDLRVWANARARMSP